MAEDIDTQDERADLEPTPEELRAAELAKTQQALALVEAAKREEASLTPPARIAPPRNRTYMGPAAFPGAASPQAFFQDAPTNLVLNRVGPPAPLTPEAQAGLQSRIATATQPESDAALLTRMQTLDRPGTRTIGVSRPPMPVPAPGEMQFQAQQGYLNDIKGGMPIAQARDKWLPLMLSGKAPLGMLTENQRLNTAMRQQQLDQQAKAQSDRMALLSRPKTSPAVINAHKALIAAELVAKQENDPGKIRAAQSARQAFEAAHPELGLAEPPNPAVATPPPPAPVTPAAKPAAPAAAKGNLSKEQAAAFKKQAGGDTVKARQLAKAAGYEFDYAGRRIQ